MVEVVVRRGYCLTTLESVGFVGVCFFLVPFSVVKLKVIKTLCTRLSVLDIISVKKRDGHEAMLCHSKVN